MKRGSDILGLSDTIAADGSGYYQTYDAIGDRIDLPKYNLSNPRHRYPATVPLISETHGGELVKDSIY